jgi:simple sugar transport system permease protein
VSDLVLSIAQAACLSATPLVLAGLGELVAERAGVINVGIEGLMLTGCIAAFAVGVVSGSGALAVGAAVLASAGLAAIFALATVRAKVDQIVCGMAINLLAVGASGLAWQVLQGTGHDELPESAQFAPLLFGQYGIAYATVALALLLWAALKWTRGGLIVRALGDAPDACAAAGIGVLRWRFLCVVAAGACAGAAGSYLSVMRVHKFLPDMTGGKGFLVLALVIFGRWHVGGLIAGCLLFGALDSLQQHLQGSGDGGIPYQAYKALPYVMALVALAALTRSAPGPARLGQPWPERE